MPADATAIAYFAPIWAFLIVFIIMFALLTKSKILGESRWLNLFISFVIASIFISAAGVQQYVLTVVPWMAVLVLSLFFILLLIGFIGKDADFMNSKMGIVVVIVAIVVFVVSGIKVFYSIISPYLPGSLSVVDADPNTLMLFDWLFSGPVLGAILLLVLSGLVSWVLVKTK